MARVNEIKVVHRRLPSAVSGRNLRILESSVREDRSARNLFYLGLEYESSGRVHDALRTLNEYVLMSGWDDEKCLALLRLTSVHHRLGQWDEAEMAASRAAALKRSWAEPLFALGRTFYLMADAGIDPLTNWRRAVDRITEGLSAPPTVTPLSVNPMERVEIHRFLNVAFSRVGDFRSALWSVRQALSSCPGDGNLLHNERVYSGLVNSP